MQTRAAIDSLYSVFKAIGGEGGSGITRRSAPRPFGAALTGVIPASSLPPSADLCRQKLTCQLAERVGFEPTNTVRCYTLSRRAPSTARPPLHAAARVPEATHAIKSSGRATASPNPGAQRSPGAAGLRAPGARSATPSRWPPYWAAPAYSAAERRDRRPWVPGAAAQAPRWE
jgi:hypothetical protein